VTNYFIELAHPKTAYNLEPLAIFKRARLFGNWTGEISTDIGLNLKLNEPVKSQIMGLSGSRPEWSGRNRVEWETIALPPHIEVASERYFCRRPGTLQPRRRHFAKQRSQGHGRKLLAVASSQVIGI
jgi:hypothetical protein